MQEMVSKMSKAFALVTLGITIAVALYLTFFTSYEHLMVIDLWRIIFLGVISGFSALIFYSPRMLSLRAMLVRHILHFLFILASVLGLAKHWQWLEEASPGQWLVVLILVIVVYAAVMLVLFWRDKQVADVLNEKLKHYQARRQ